jgi:hypothetical protein
MVTRWLNPISRFSTAFTLAESSAIRSPTVARSPTVLLVQVAVDADPVVGGGGAFVVPEVGLDELRREPRLLEQLKVDAMLTLDQLLGEFGTPIDCLEHEESVRTNVRYVKLIYTKNSSHHHSYRPPGVTTPPSSQSVFSS